MSRSTAGWSGVNRDREVRVAAIDGERVLHEVVRADAEERDVVRRTCRTATAAAGVSIITPSGTSRRNSAPRACEIARRLVEQLARLAHLVDA